jgi:hypothetical protein
MEQPIQSWKRYFPYRRRKQVDDPPAEIVEAPRRKAA